MIRLAAVDRYNWRELADLSVKPEQEQYLASNVRSLAQAYAEPWCTPLGIYRGIEPVGFLLYGLDPDDRQYWVYRLMIDARYQGNGYGEQALGLLFESLRADFAHDRVYISVVQGNDHAKRINERMGFTADGRVYRGEEILVRPLRREHG